MTSKSEIKSTLKNASIYAVASIIEKAVGFVMLPFYAYLLGSEGYGIIGMIEVVTSVLSIFVLYGVANAVNRFYFEKKTEKERKLLISTTMFTMFLICAVFCLPAIALNRPIAYFVFGKDDLGLYIVISICSFMIDSTAHTGQQYLLIQQRSLLVSAFSILRLLLAVTLNIYLIVILRIGVIGVLYSHLITAIIFFIIYNTYTLSKTRIHFNKNDARDILYFSIPLIPGYIGMFVRSNADKIILRTFLGLSEIGIYSMVMKFSMLLGLFFFEPFMKTWIPKRMELCDYPHGRHTITKVFTIHMVIMLFAGLILSLEIPLLIELMAPPEFWVTSFIGLLAVFSRICFNMYYHLNFGLLYAKKTFLISKILIITAILSVPLYVIFIKYLGIEGAFFAAIIAYSIQCSLTYYFANRYYEIKYEWRTVMISTIVAIILFIIINQISFDYDCLNNAIKTYILSPLNRMLLILNLDNFKNGKLIFYLNEKFILLFEAFLKGILGMSYFIVLFLFRVIPLEMLNNFRFFKVHNKIFS